MYKEEKTDWILIFLVVLLFLGVTVGNGFAEMRRLGNGYAQIKKQYDDFNESTTYFSEIYKFPPWHDILMSFTKKEGKFTGKFLSCELIERSWHFFDAKDLKMKIDRKIIEIDYLSSDSKSYTYNDTFLTSGVYRLKDSHLRKINEANEITIRVFLRNVSNITWDVPDEILNEWKKLIEISEVLK